MEVLERRRRELEKRLKLAKRFANSVSDALGPVTVVVIGSTARGDFNAWSDIDVVIISDNFPTNPLERYEILEKHVEPGIEPIPLRPEDVKRLVEKNSPVVIDIARGIVLRDDLRILETLRTDMPNEGAS